MWNKHNKLTDKNSDSDYFFKPLLGDSIIGAKNDDDWRKKRKACAHGFYKERMKHMIVSLKNQVNSRIQKWKAEIEANGST